MLYRYYFSAANLVPQVKDQPEDGKSTHCLLKDRNLRNTCPDTSMSLVYFLLIISEIKTTSRRRSKGTLYFQNQFECLLVYFILFRFISVSVTS